MNERRYPRRERLGDGREQLLVRAQQSQFRQHAAQVRQPALDLQSYAQFALAAPEGQSAHLALRAHG